MTDTRWYSVWITAITLISAVGFCVWIWLSTEKPLTPRELWNLEEQEGWQK